MKGSRSLGCRLKAAACVPWGSGLYKRNLISEKLHESKLQVLASVVLSVDVTGELAHEVLLTLMGITAHL